MKTVYDEDTQKLIDFYENRKADITIRVSREVGTMEGYARYIRALERNPHYHPVYDDPEYQLACKALERIYTTSVPKYILTKEEYEAYKNGR